MSVFLPTTDIYENATTTQTGSGGTLETLIVGGSENFMQTNPFTSLFEGWGFDMGEITNAIFTGNFSCINATHTPAKVQNNIETILAPYFSEGLNAVSGMPFLQALEELQKYMKYAKGGEIATLSTSKEPKWSDCSRESLLMYSDWYAQIYQTLEEKRAQVVQALQNENHNITSTTQTLQTKNWDIGDKPNTFQGDIGLNAYGANYEANPTFQFNSISVKQGLLSGTLGNLTNNLQLGSGGGLFGFALIGTALYWVYDKYFKNNKKRKKRKNATSKRFFK